jgi:hypothetical protein
VSRPNSPGLFGLKGIEPANFSVAAAFSARASFAGGGDGLEGALAVLRDAALAAVALGAFFLAIIDGEGRPRFRQQAYRYRRRGAVAALDLRHMHNMDS